MQTLLQLPDNLVEEANRYISLDNQSEAMIVIIQEWIAYKKRQELLEKQAVDMQWSEDYKKHVLGNWQGELVRPDDITLEKRLNW
jgi:hypothetical protein